MNDDKISIEVSYTSDDLYDLQKAVFYRGVSQKVFVIIGIVFLILAAISIVSDPPFGNFPFVTFFLFFFSLFSLVIIPSALKKGAVKALKTSKLLQQKQTFQIGAEGIAVASESGSGFIKWNEFYKATESKEAFMFFIGMQQAYVIPKRYLNGNEDDLQQIRKYLNSVPPLKDTKKSLNTD